MKIHQVTEVLDSFAEMTSDVLCHRRSFFGKMVGLFTLVVITPRLAFGDPVQYTIVPCGPGGPQAPSGKPKQATAEDGNTLWTDTGLTNPPVVEGVGTNPPAAPALNHWIPVMNNLNTPNCGNGGVPCSSAIDQTNPKCCKCKTNGACPDGLSMGSGSWTSCCGSAEYEYKDCCGTKPKTAQCPEECYIPAPSSRAAGIECKQGYESSGTHGWCNGSDIEYCTPPGTQTGKCCQAAN